MNALSADDKSNAVDVLAMGNAIVDVLVHTSDEQVAEEGLRKGSMNLIGEERAVELYDRVGPAIEISGGSAANTAAGLASLGAATRFLGKVCDDQLGAVFAHDLRAAGVTFDTPPLASAPATARSIIMVSPDAERTMSTYLGAAAELGTDDLQVDDVRMAAMLYVEGYLFDSPATHAAVVKALEIARDFGVETSLLLSDLFLVQRYGDDLHDQCRRGIDIVIGNETEMMAMCEDDLSRMSDLGRIVVCTRGPDGSTVLSGSYSVDVPASDVAEVVDTTGAGDLFAAGFLYGHSRRLPLADCARVGAMAAGEVIGHIGARPAVQLSSLVTEFA